MKFLFVLISGIVGIIALCLIGLAICFFINYIDYKDTTPKISSKLTFNQFKAFYYTNPKVWSLDYFTVNYCIKKKISVTTLDFYYPFDYKKIYFTSFWQWVKYNRWKRKKEEQDEWNKTFKEMTDLVGFWQEDVNQNQQKILDELKEKINETKKF